MRRVSKSDEETLERVMGSESERVASSVSVMSALRNAPVMMALELGAQPE